MSGRAAPGEPAEPAAAEDARGPGDRAAELGTVLDGEDAVELAAELAQHHRELAVAAAVARAGVTRAEAIAAAGEPLRPARLPPPAERERWGWRRAVRFAVERRMYTPQHQLLYARYLLQRLRQPNVELLGMVFLGRRVQLRARRHHARLSVGAWSWIGSGNRLNAHEGNLRLGHKVVMGSVNVVNCYLDIEIGQGSLLGDWIYVCDFDHAYADPTRPIRKQGLVKTPVRIGEDVWVGEKASILRGADIGSGTVVGSQALVKSRIPPFSIVVGSPARVIGSRLPKGMTAEEALDLQRRHGSFPGDALDRES